MMHNPPCGIEQCPDPQQEQHEDCSHMSPGRPEQCSMHNQQRSMHNQQQQERTSGSFMRAKVSRGPPRHAAQLGAAGVVQPASSKISAAVLPSQPGTGSVYTSAHTCRSAAKMARCQQSLMLLRACGCDTCTLTNALQLPSGTPRYECVLIVCRTIAHATLPSNDASHLLCGWHQVGGPHNCNTAICAHSQNPAASSSARQHAKIRMICLPCRTIAHAMPDGTLFLRVSHLCVCLAPGG
jgi:hypothetical protein